MARIFRTEQLEINGNIRLSTEGTPGAFEIRSASGSTLHMSKASIENDISSLAAKNTELDGDILAAQTQDGVIATAVLAEHGKDADIAVKVGQRATKDGQLDVNVSTLEDGDDTIVAAVLAEHGKDSDIAVKVGQRATKDGDLAGDISTLKTKNQTRDSDISSLATSIATNDVVAKSVSAGDTDDETVNITFGREFTSVPAVIATMKSSVSTDPIIPVMVTASSETGCTVSFGDGLPNGNYTVEVLASVA